MTATERTPTRQQQFFSRAWRDVATVAQGDRDVASRYGGLCHKLPVLVHTNGLCATLAYIQAKASGKTPLGNAYRLLGTHLAGVLGFDNMDKLAEHIRTKAQVTDYIWYTRTLLAAGLYYKRFAVSVLDVSSAEQLIDEGE